MAASLRAPRITSSVLTTSVVTAALAAALTLTACGGDDDASPAATSADPSDAAAVSADASDGTDDVSAESGADSSAAGDGAEDDGSSGEGAAGSGDVVPGDDLAARVSAAIVAAGSARSTLTSTLADSTITAEGVVDFTQPYRLDITTTIGSEGGELASRVVAVSESEIYVQVPEAEQWFRIDASDDGGLLGELGTEYYSPEDTWTTWGASGDFEVVGQETVEGVDATHYRLTGADAQLAEGLTSVDVWVGDDDLPVKAEVGVADPTPSTVSIVYSDWGTPVDIQPPPADQILEF